MWGESCTCCNFANASCCYKFFVVIIFNTIIIFLTVSQNCTIYFVSENFSILFFSVSSAFYDAIKLLVIIKAFFAVKFFLNLMCFFLGGGESCTCFNFANTSCCYKFLISPRTFLFATQNLVIISEINI